VRITIEEDDKTGGNVITLIGTSPDFLEHTTLVVRTVTAVEVIDRRHLARDCKEI
jgi:hypothetical protein